MIAQIVCHIDSIFNIEAIEAYCILAYRRSERVLQQSHLVIVNIHISEYILQYGVQNISCFYKFAYSCCALSYNNIFSERGDLR